MLPVETDVPMEDGMRNISIPDSYQEDASPSAPHFPYHPGGYASDYPSAFTANLMPYRTFNYLQENSDEEVPPPSSYSNIIVEESSQMSDQYFSVPPSHVVSTEQLSNVAVQEEDEVSPNQRSPTEQMVGGGLQSLSNDTSHHNQGGPLRSYDPVSIKEKACPEFIFEMFSKQITDQIHSNLPLANTFQNAHSLMKNILLEREVRDNVSSFISFSLDISRFFILMSAFYFLFFMIVLVNQLSNGYEKRKTRLQDQKLSNYFN
jgi:hypothetical protein